MCVALGWQWLSSSCSCWSCGCARLPCNRAAFISSGSFPPAQPGLFPCFINFWRQPSVNPSPNHCNSLKQVFSETLLPWYCFLEINTCSTTCNTSFSSQWTYLQVIPLTALPRNCKNTLVRLFSCALRSCSRLSLKVFH